MSRSRVLAVVPARYRSTRFPGKPLAMIDGVPMIVHVYRRAAAIEGVDETVVATDDERIREVVLRFGGRAVMTSSLHRTGTSRVREVASRRRHSVILNVQGDEPVLPVRCVERLIETMRRYPGIPMGTLAVRESDERELARPDVVKVVCDRGGRALLFSRARVPHGRGPALRHIGVYAYRRAFLMRFTRLTPGPLERRESLEQLRALENGFEIRVVTCRTGSISVDRPEDIKRVEKWLQSR